MLLFTQDPLGICDAFMSNFCNVMVMLGFLVNLEHFEGIYSRRSFLPHMAWSLHLHTVSKKCYQAVCNVKMSFLWCFVKETLNCFHKKRFVFGSGWTTSVLWFCFIAKNLLEPRNVNYKCNNIKEPKGWFSVASLSFGKGTLPLLSHGQDVKCYFEREKCQNALKAQNLGWFLQLHQAVDDLCLSQTGCQIQLLSGGHWFSISPERYKYWNQLCFHLNSAKMMTIADTSWSKLAAFYWWKHNMQF